MHADEFFSTALDHEEASAALVHHKVVLAPKLFGGGGGNGLRCDTHANMLQGRSASASAATPQLYAATNTSFPKVKIVCGTIAVFFVFCGAKSAKSA